MNVIGKWPTSALFTLLVTWLLAGCGVTTEALIPEKPVEVSQVYNRVVKVMPVKGGQKSTFTRKAAITNEQFHTALFKTLQDAKFFARLVNEGESDWDLYTQITKIDTKMGITSTYTIEVQYRLMDAESNKEIWSKQINTSHQAKWKEVLASATHIAKGLEKATEENLVKLVQALSQADL